MVSIQAVKFLTLESSFELANLYQLDIDTDVMARHYGLSTENVSSFACSILKLQRVGELRKCNWHNMVVVWK